MPGKLIMRRRGALALGIGGIAIAWRPAWAAQGVAASAIDGIVSAFMSAFEIPGIGVAIIRPEKPAFARGYGLRTLGRPERVDENTLFAIASNTKSFTAAALALLVEEGKLGWNEPVVNYMPDFTMSDATATRMMTVQDLLVHRSGLALGAGDLMRFPSSDRTRAEILLGLKYLPLATGFRSEYAYDNILYIVAGILVERVSGMEWEDFVTARLLRPLGMADAVSTRSRVQTANVAGRHARLGPPARGLGKLEVLKGDETTAAAPAGGIHASARDIISWLSLQLGKGELPGGRRVWSKEQTTKMWTPQVITQSTHGPTPELPTRPVLAGYALGWFVQDWRGRRLIHHSGGWRGQITFTALLPEQGIGLAVFSNTEDRAAVAGLRSALLDHLLGVDGFDWIAATRKEVDESRQQVLKLAGNSDFAAPPGAPSLPLSSYAGRYRDAWYGDVVITDRGGGLFIDFTRTPVFKSMLEPFGPDAFRTRFARGAGEDAVVTFTVKGGLVAGVKMRALSPLADFSYDFHDLVLTRVQ